MSQPIEIHASKTDLAAACPASVIVPQVEYAPRVYEGELGRAAHRLRAREMAGERVEPADVAAGYGVEPGDLEVLGVLMRGLWLGRTGSGYEIKPLEPFFPDPLVEHEMSYADPRGIVLRGTADLLSVVPRMDWLEDGTYRLVADEVKTLDWKTGRGDTSHDNQVKAYAFLALQEHPNADRAYTAVVRVRDESTDLATYSRRELAEWWDRFVTDLLRHPKGYNPGAHCGFCWRALECPARSVQHRQFNRALLGARPHYLLATGWAADQADYMAAWKAELGEALPADRAERGVVLGELRDRLRMVGLMNEAIKDAIRTQVAIDGGNLPAGPDRELRLVQISKRKILPKHAWPLLLEELGLERLLECVDIRKTRVEELVRAKTERGKKEAVDRHRERLEAAGAFTVEEETRLELKRVARPILEDES